LFKKEHILLCFVDLISLINSATCRPILISWEVLIRVPLERFFPKVLCLF